jgi:hypothetical protein
MEQDRRPAAIDHQVGLTVLAPSDARVAPPIGQYTAILAPRIEGHRTRNRRWARSA